MVRGVLSVEPIVSDSYGHIAEERAKREIYSKILDLIYPDRKSQ